MARLAILPRPTLERLVLEVQPSEVAIDDDRLPVAFWVEGNLTGFASGLDPRCRVELWYESPQEPPQPFRNGVEPIRAGVAPGPFRFVLCDFGDLAHGSDLEDDERIYFALLVSEAVREGETDKVIAPGPDVSRFGGALSSASVPPRVS
jgi:hypothetical protein